MRIGIAGFLHESNTFLASATGLEQFHITRGGEVPARFATSHHEWGGFLAGLAPHRDVTAVPLITAYAVPSGTVTRECFEAIAGEITAAIAAAQPLDGLLLGLHGATVAEGYPDADGELLARAGRAMGAGPIAVTYDLHANVSEAMIEGAAAAVFYRSNPHLDQRQRGVDAADLLVRTLRGEIKPTMALERPPLLIDITRQNTGESPARELYADIGEVMTWPGILSASVAMGFYYADVAEMGASFLAIADGDPCLARKAARWMSERAWARRREFLGAAIAPAEAVREAAGEAGGPVVLLDVGDNVGGGGSADSTVLLGEAMRQGVRNALIVLHAPEAAARCASAGVGAEVELEAGSPPVAIRGRVRTLSDGVFIETQVRHGSQPVNDQGLTAVVETAEEHTVVFTSNRMAPMSLEQILSLGIKPERKKILIVKGVVAPRAAYDPVARRTILVDTAGVTASNPMRFDYLRRRRPLFPLENI